MPIGSMTSHAVYNDGTTAPSGSELVANSGIQPTIFLITTNGTNMRVWSRQALASVKSQKVDSVIAGTKVRTIDKYAICNAFITGANRPSRAKILTHGIAGGAKAQALYDDPEAFFDALGRVYGL